MKLFIDSLQYQGSQVSIQTCLSKITDLFQDKVQTCTDLATHEMQTYLTTFIIFQIFQKIKLKGEN